MKKILFLIIIVLLVGCTDLSNTPAKRVEIFFKKYQTLDSVVIKDLNDTINKDNLLTEEQKIIYRDIMKKHYQNLKYKIKESTIDGDEAIVTVLIEVTDFKKVKEECNKYLQENQAEFQTNGNYDSKLYNNYTLDKLKKATDKVSYTLNLSLSKDDKEWKLDNINSSIYEKINGIYEY